MKRWFLISCLVVVCGHPLAAQETTDDDTVEPSESYAEMQEMLELEDEFLRSRRPVDPPSGIGFDAEYEDLGADVFAPSNEIELGGMAEPYAEWSGAQTPAVVETEWSYDPNAITSLPFGLDTVQHLPLLEFLEFYNTEGRNRITRWIGRSGRYSEMIRAEARRQGAPEELIWIAAIESGFQNDAVSSRSATGMWQFMSRSAIGRGMRIDGSVDERMDPVISTRFAIDYLLYQYERFGTWPLAFAAYNAGSGHVRGEIRSNNVNDFWVMEEYGALYDDARRYALRAMALATIALNPEVFGFDGVVLDDPFEFDEVTVEPGARLSRLADALDISVGELREYNPSLVGDRIPSDVDAWTLRIPPGTYADFVDDYDRYEREYDGEMETAVLWFGEEMEDLAERFGLPERVVRRANGFSSRDHVEYGTELLIPVDGRSDSDDDAESAEPLTVVVPEQTFAFADRVRVFYEVNALDTISQIADHFEVDLYELCAWNDVAADATLWSGMELQVFVSPSFDLSTTRYRSSDEVNAIALNSPEWEAHMNAGAEESRSRRRTYTVQSGDSVSRIARRFDVTVRDIIRWNDLDDDAMIIVGDELIVGR